METFGKSQRRLQKAINFDHQILKNTLALTQFCHY